MGEADRAAVIMAVVEKRMRQREAAERLGLCVRQVKRLAKRYWKPAPDHPWRRPFKASGREAA